MAESLLITVALTVIDFKVLISYNFFLAKTIPKEGISWHPDRF